MSKTVCFTLSMPNNNSWNGRWSGQGKLYARVRTLTIKQCEALDGQSFYYNFGDGWGASVSVNRVSDAAESRRIRKQSLGFCGYDWMIDSIVRHGKIQIPERQTA